MSDTESKPVYKQVTLQPRMLDMGEWKTIRRQTGVKQVTKNIGIFNKKEVTVDEPVYETTREWINSGKQSDVQIDLVHFGEMIEDTCNALHDDGYDVMEILPIIRGNYQYRQKNGSLRKGTGHIGHAMGFGYSVTDGVIILAKRR